MPPSPAMRISPRRELRLENHKRGRSLESGIIYREKDDDLALFDEVQSKEKESFLLQSNDDFDDLFSNKLRYFSDYTLGISVPARGESSNLLNAEGEKNDYDWLITPPETPLFRSLDDDKQPISLAPRGRSRSQPVPIPQSSKDTRSSRGSASPHRLSPSPRSVNNTSKNRPFSATHSSPPSRKLSPPPSKLISPSPRSITPTPRRLSTGSTNPRATGVSPVKTTTTRGNSASPKTRTWQSNSNNKIPDFSLEAPPNLRTSIADRPASYVRGSSPASRNGSQRTRRESMSPTPSRSIGSPAHSRDKDAFGSHGKGSVASSGDDDVDLLRSFPVRSVGGLANSKAPGFSKKTNKALSSSAPKRSFDLALRQMDKKGPQNMFRPLLSSVPSSTFYAAKSNQRSLVSRNSSITTSSNASSDQGTSGAHDTEEIEQKSHENVTSDGIKENFHDEIFAMEDPVDTRNEDTEINEPFIVNSQLGVDISTDMDKVDDDSNDHVTPDLEICSICGNEFQLHEIVSEGDLHLCPECKNSQENYTSTLPSVEVLNQSTLLQESPELTSSSKNETHQLEEIANQGQNETNQNPPLTPVKAATQPLDSESGQGAGISVLLKKSRSGKGHILQSRSFTASNVCYDDFSYVRDSVNNSSIRSSIGHSTASVSSSFDMGSSKKTETRIFRQSSTENYTYDTPTKHKRSASSLFGGATSMASECTDAESTELSSHLMNVVHSGDVSLMSILTCEEPTSHENGDSSLDNKSEIPVSSSFGNKSEIPVSSSFGNKSEIGGDDIVSEDSESDVDSVTDSKDCEDELPEHFDLELHDDDVAETVEELDISSPANGVVEESFIVSEKNPIEPKDQILTLEDATDAILFCRSIVHNMAYEAASIAIDKEKNPLVEILQPTVTFVGKSNSDRRDLRARTATKRGTKSQKPRQMRFENVTRSPPINGESDEKASPRNDRGSPCKGDSVKVPPKLESKCNCTIM